MKFTGKKFVIRLVKFAIVGGSGIVVNTLMLWLCHDIIGLPVYLASPIAIFTAIFNNFHWNNYWTWNSRKDSYQHSYLHRLWRYYISAAFGASINYVILLLLVKFLSIHYLIANLVGIFLGMLSNFLLSEFWVFRKIQLDNE